MSLAYIRAVRENIKRAVHVFDHFHVIKLYNDKPAPPSVGSCSTS